jgi:hypothetical protein
VSAIARVVVFEILKTSSRKAAQVIIFKDPKRIFIVLVDNFVRNWPARPDDHSPGIPRARAQRRARKKKLTIFNELQHLAQCNSACPAAASPASPFCA